MKKISLILFLTLACFTIGFAQADQNVAAKKVQPVKVKPANKENASYALGVALSNSFQRDSLHMQYDRFFKGIHDIYNKQQPELSDEDLMATLRSFGANKAGADMKKISYAIGLSVAKNFLKGGLGDINLKTFQKAINDVLANKPLLVELKEANQIISTYQKEKMDKQATLAKAGGVKFLAENGKKEGITTTASGLQYKVLQKGTGIQPSAKDKVTVHYTGTLIDGTKFDSSVDRGKPATFGLNQVIKGWTEGVQLMKEGAKYRFYIPYHLAYGERGSPPNIPGFAALIFDIDLIKVVKAVPTNSKQ